jgi:hypothetical protein
MEAAVVPGNEFLIKSLAALYSNRKRSKVYLNSKFNNLNMRPKIKNII